MIEDRDINNSKHNSIYYNQMLRASEKKKQKPINSSKNESFGSKQVDFGKYLIVPSDYEGIAYTLYCILIPYIVGITFLYFYVAEGVYTNFSFLDLSSFLLIWAIGYEITAAVILLFIFISFLKHLRRAS